MTVFDRDFSKLNSLRPANAGFGEVVCIELFYQGVNLGYSKRKSIHVPPSSNAYWNFMGLQALITRHASEMGMSRSERREASRILRRAVEQTHKVELVRTYDKDMLSIQYYDLYIFESPLMWANPEEVHFVAAVQCTASRRETSMPLFSVD